MSNDHLTTRRALFAAVPAIAAMAAFPAIATPHPLEKFRSFLRFAADRQGERALDHAIAAGMRPENLSGIFFTTVQSPGPDMLPVLMFKTPGGLRSFRPRGEDR